MKQNQAKISIIMHFANSERLSKQIIIKEWIVIIDANIWEQ